MWPRQCTSAAGAWLKSSFYHRTLRFSSSSSATRQTTKSPKSTLQNTRPAATLFRRETCRRLSLSCKSPTGGRVSCAPSSPAAHREFQRLYDDTSPSTASSKPLLEVQHQRPDSTGVPAELTTAAPFSVRHPSDSTSIRLGPGHTALQVSKSTKESPQIVRRRLSTLLKQRPPHLHLYFPSLLSTLNP